MVTPGQAGDAPALPLLLAELKVYRQGPGRPRTTPQALRGDKAYSSKAIRACLRARGITAVIPEPKDQLGHRKPDCPQGHYAITTHLTLATLVPDNVAARQSLQRWRAAAHPQDHAA